MRPKASACPSPFHRPAALYPGGLSGSAEADPTPVFATADGLELVAARRTVPWSSIAKARRIPLSGLLPIYRVTFTGGTPALTFYGQQELEQVLRTYQARALTR